MGILNITPDSFSDGGRLLAGAGPRLDRVLRRAEAMLAGGAAMLDVGGESTRPGAAPVGEQEEIDRVAPVVAAIAARLDVVISVDTSNPRLMREAAALGAGLINDVRSLRREGALEAARDSGLAVCIMHMQGEPGTMQQTPSYTDVTAEVSDYLLARASDCERAGIARERLVIDPGFGFGKTLGHNLALFRGLRATGGARFSGAGGGFAQVDDRAGHGPPGASPAGGRAGVGYTCGGCGGQDRAHPRRGGELRCAEDGGGDQ